MWCGCAASASRQGDVDVSTAPRHAGGCDGASSERVPFDHVDQERRGDASPPAPVTLSGATAAELFGLLWDTMADVLGTAATATLLRRALKRAGARSADLGGVAIDRDDL